MSELVADTRVIAVDVPFTSHASDVDDALVEILDREGVGTATFLGASFGGMLIQAFAQSHPERVTKLILSQTGSPGGLGGKGRFWARAVRLIPLFVLKGLLRLLLRKMLGKVPDGAFWNDHYRGVVDSLDHASLKSRYELAADLAESYEWTPGAAGLWDGPVTILQSHNDSMVNRRTKDALGELYPSATSGWFPTDGHGAYVHDPLGFTRSVKACFT
jgi:pimeloyl-ACP methyl ester carboxylesterase